MPKKKIDWWWEFHNRVVWKIPHEPTQHKLGLAYRFAANLKEFLGDEIFEMKMRSKHHFLNGGSCSCGYDVGDREKDWDIHYERARDAEWDKRWD